MRSRGRALDWPVLCRAERRDFKARPLAKSHLEHPLKFTVAHSAAAPLPDWSSLGVEVTGACRVTRACNWYGCAKECSACSTGNMFTDAAITKPLWDRALEGSPSTYWSSTHDGGADGPYWSLDFRIGKLSTQINDVTLAVRCASGVYAGPKAEQLDLPEGSAIVDASNKCTSGSECCDENGQFVDCWAGPVSQLVWQNPSPAQRISNHGTNVQGWQSAIGSTVRDPSEPAAHRLVAALEPSHSSRVWTSSGAVGSRCMSIVVDVGDVCFGEMDPEGIESVASV